MATMTQVPKHFVTEEGGTKSIEMAGWTIAASVKTIVTASEADALQKQLGIPIPEMTFGNNRLSLLHRESGWRYTFDVTGALRCVKSGELEPGDGGVKVGYAAEWLKSRTVPGTSIPMPKLVETKPYDWTYTSMYSGHVTNNDEDDVLPIGFSPADPGNPAHAIPLTELKRPDPILFYAEIPLFEDELHDNGSSHLSIRIRVMPGCFFVLSRFTLRVDNVLFRSYDTRIYHSFSSAPPTLVKETSGWEAPYETIKSFLPERDDLTLLTKPDFIGSTLSTLPKLISQGQGAETQWRGLGTKTEVAYLSRPRSNMDTQAAAYA